MYLPSFFLLLLLASFSDSLFLFFAGADQPLSARTKSTQRLEKRSHAHENKQHTALPEEHGEPDLIELPRIIFRFNRKSIGRLRQLINAINAIEEG